MDDYVEELRGVLQFLQDHGFNKAADAVYEQLDAKQPSEHSESTLPADQEEPTAEEGAEEATEANDDASSVAKEGYRSKSAEPVLSSRDDHGPLQESEAPSPWSHGEPCTLTRKLSGSTRLYEDPDIDEYDGMEDCGYIRRTISRQQDFIRYQLGITPSEDDSGLGLQDASGADSPTGSLSSSASLSSPGFGDKLSSLQTHQDHARGAAQQEGSPGSSEADGAWEAGPAGIILTAPVTTPTKDSRRSSNSDIKPSLSRVESLSNSFIDDMESFECASAPLSDAGSASLDQEGSAAGGGIVDLQPASPPASGFGGALDSYPGIFDLGLKVLATRTASTEVLHGSVAGMSESGSELNAEQQQRQSRPGPKHKARLAPEAGARSGLGQVEVNSSSSSAAAAEAQEGDLQGVCVEPAAGVVGAVEGGEVSPELLGPSEPALTAAAEGTEAKPAAAADGAKAKPAAAADGAEAKPAAAADGAEAKPAAATTAVLEGEAFKVPDVLEVAAAVSPVVVEDSKVCSAGGSIEGPIPALSEPTAAGAEAADVGAPPATQGDAVKSSKEQLHEQQQQQQQQGRHSEKVDTPDAKADVGIGFGFSFPVTPPTDEEEHFLETRAERVFSTWASSASRTSLQGLGGSDDEDAVRSCSGALAHARSSASNKSQDLSGIDLQPAATSSPGGAHGSAGGSGRASRAGAGSDGGKAGVLWFPPLEEPCSTGAGEGASPGAASRGGLGSQSSGGVACNEGEAMCRAGSSNLSSSSSREPKGSSDPKQQQQQAAVEEGEPGPLGESSAQESWLGGFDLSERPSGNLDLGGIEPDPVDSRAASGELQQEEDTGSIGTGAGSFLEGPQPRYVVDENGNLLYEYDQEYISAKYEMFDLKIIHRRRRTGFEDSKEFSIRKNDLIAGRYQVMDFLGSAAFSQAVQALDVATGTLVCLKIIKNNKDYLDQSLDEIKLLRYVNGADPADEHGIVRLYDFLYFKEHLILVCELLRANLYEFQKYQRDNGDEPYFTLPRIQKIATQVLRSLAFLHGLGLVHSDLKPENILIKSYSRCEVKVIDLGSSCYTTDHLSSYVQSRSYRAPEVILGLRYDTKVDIWSLGCILAELSTGYVLLQNDSVATLLARLEGIIGPVPSWMISQGRYGSRYYTRSRQLYERSRHGGRFELLLPKRTSLRHRVPEADEGFLDFLSYLLTIDPNMRPTAEEALSHPWLFHPYPPVDPVQD